MMSFFVTSSGSGARGGNLGGLSGADARCDELARAAGVTGKTWRAYLSTNGSSARSRIGSGPWVNSAGVRIVNTDCGTPGSLSCVDDLHANGIAAEQVLTERGTQIDWRNAHDIVTGSDSNGDPTGLDCAGWTSNREDLTVTVGHSFAGSPEFPGSWNSAHPTGCDEVGLQCTAGQGNLYCFAVD